MAAMKKMKCALAFLKSVEGMFEDERDKYHEFLQLMKDFQSPATETAVIVTKVKGLLKGHRGMILGFNTFLPKDYKIELDEKLPAKYEEAILFVDRMKKVFHADGGGDEFVYRMFLNNLNMYRRGDKSLEEMQQVVATLFRKHKDLLDDFNGYLLPACGRRCRCDDDNDNGGLCKRSKPSPVPHDDSLELDLSKLERSSRSYHRKLEPNDSKIMSKTRNERIILRCEEDQYEVDMLIALVKTTKEKVKGLIEKMRAAGPESRIRVEDSLSSINLRCIERLYGEYGIEMRDLLSKNSRKALPIVLIRLEQEQEKLLRELKHCIKIWCHIYQKYNHNDSKVERGDQGELSGSDHLEEDITSAGETDAGAADTVKL